MPALLKLGELKWRHFSFKDRIQKLSCTPKTAIEATNQNEFSYSKLISTRQCTFQCYQNGIGYFTHMISFIFKVL
jgi:hypothetical protein